MIKNKERYRDAYRKERLVNIQTRNWGRPYQGRAFF